VLYSTSIVDWAELDYISRDAMIMLMMRIVEITESFLRTSLRSDSWYTAL